LPTPLEPYETTQYRQTKNQHNNGSYFWNRRSCFTYISSSIPIAILLAWIVSIGTIVTGIAIGIIILIHLILIGCLRAIIVFTTHTIAIHIFARRAYQHHAPGAIRCEFHVGHLWGITLCYSHIEEVPADDTWCRRARCSGSG